MLLAQRFKTNLVLSPLSQRSPPAYLRASHPWACTPRQTRGGGALASSGGADAPDMKDVASLMQKYNGGGVPGGGVPAPRPAGVVLLVVLNCGLFVAATVGKSAWAASLAINPAAVKWWSFISSAFVHHNLEQLGRNMFVVFFFSQMVYNELGAVGVWFSYLLCGLGANLCSWFFLAGSAKAKALAMLGLASSGSALGIFLAALVLSFRPTLAWLLGAALSGNFVVSMLVNAPTAASIAPASGAAVGAMSSGAALLGGPPEKIVAALLKKLQASAVEPGNAWAVGAALAAAIVVMLARLPDDGK